MAVLNKKSYSKKPAKLPSRAALQEVLRRAAPDAWREFSAALQNYAGQQLHEMAVAPTDKLQVAQGRAQMLISLLKTFEQSLVMAEKILDNRKA
jgi:hypothetical protein